MLLLLLLFTVPCKGINFTANCLSYKTTEMAVKNERLGKKIDTVLFLDEANTTDALGMIKEIIVDRRCNGRPLSDNLKFVVACNPYRK